MPTPQLKPNTFLGVQEVMDHLKIPVAKFDEYESQVVRLINMTTDQFEKYIQTWILVRQEIEEIKDGDSSNVLVPSYGPVRKVKELRIDYNGQFDAPSTVIDAEFLAIRGFPAPDFAVKIKGTDIVVRNDGNTSIVGRLFIGSTAQSIKLTYDAGLAYTKEEVPEDIVYAALMNIEYYYITRENREINIRSKNNNNQGYSREIGMPKEVKDILDPYVDLTLGINNRPQKNTFTF